jgi:hypothetical protein
MLGFGFAISRLAWRAGARRACGGETIFAEEFQAFNLAGECGGVFDETAKFGAFLGNMLGQILHSKPSASGKNAGKGK